MRELVARHGEDRSGIERHRGVPFWRGGADDRAAPLFFGPRPGCGQTPRPPPLILRKNGFRSARISAICGPAGFHGYGSAKHDRGLGGVPTFGWRRFLLVAGPGIVVMLADTDAGSIITAAQSGAQWGYRLLLLQFVLVPILFIVQELTVRLGIVDRQGPRRADPRALRPRLGLVVGRHAGRRLHRRAVERVLRHRRRRRADRRARAGDA